VIASRTPGFVGADLANIVNEAALLAAPQEQGCCRDEGSRRGDRPGGGRPGEEEPAHVETREEIVAFHESGHAIVASHVPNADPVHRISIIREGSQALGYTLQLPTRTAT